MTDKAPFGTLICDDYGSRCDCCERLVGRTRSSFWHAPHRICHACFAVWYDGGLIDPAMIKAAVLRGEATGTFPFPCPGTGADRLPE